MSAIPPNGPSTLADLALIFQKGLEMLNAALEAPTSHQAGPSVAGGHEQEAIHTQSQVMAPPSQQISSENYVSAMPSAMILDGCPQQRAPVAPMVASNGHASAAVHGDQRSVQQLQELVAHQATMINELIGHQDLLRAQKDTAEHNAQEAAGELASINSYIDFGEPNPGSTANTATTDKLSRQVAWFETGRQLFGDELEGIEDPQSIRERLSRYIAMTKEQFSRLALARMCKSIVLLFGKQELWNEGGNIGIVVGKQAEGENSDIDERFIEVQNIGLEALSAKARAKAKGKKKEIVKQ